MTLVSLFEEQVRKTPDEVALVSDEMTLTFQELNTLANRLSEPLREHGVTAGSVVGLCMQRSAMAIATLLSILKSGAVIFLKLVMVLKSGSNRSSNHINSACR